MYDKALGAVWKNVKEMENLSDGNLKSIDLYLKECIHIYENKRCGCSSTNSRHPSVSRDNGKASLLGITSPKGCARMKR